MGYSEECSKPKKTKIAESSYIPVWKNIPTLILEKIFEYLDPNDRINASCTCHGWRQLYFRPQFHKVVKFDIQPRRLEKAQFKIRKFGHMVTHALITFNSLSPVSVNEFINLLRRFELNKNLSSIKLEPMFSRIELRPHIMRNFNGSESPLIESFLNLCSNRAIECLDVGLNEELAQKLPEILTLLQHTKPDKLVHLGMASVKDDFSNYLIYQCDPLLFKPFINLQVLSIDYDILNDDLLNSLQFMSELQRLVVHVHGIWEGHPGTSEIAWIHFTQNHPRCELRVSLIHAYDEVLKLQDILKRNMPLSHLKVLFCENINLTVLNLLSTNYSETFRSLMWVDSQSHGELSNSWNIVRHIEEAHAETDPLVMLAWRCRLLEELVLIGYKYTEHDLIAIARLRAHSLKKLEISSDDIMHYYDIYDDCENSFDKRIMEISELLKKPWTPLQASDLHPVILDPTGGDSDEYLMPILLNDMK